MSAQTVIEAFLQMGEQYAHYVLFSQQLEGVWRRMQWRHCLAEVLRVARLLERLGCQPGDRVALICSTRAEWLIVDLATQLLGAVNVGVYPTLTPAQMAFLIRHSGSRFVFVEQRAILDAVKAEQGVDVVERWCLISDTLCADISEVGDELTWALPPRFVEPHAEDVAWAKALAAQRKPEDLAALVYTSGTTGEPKGVMLSHGNFYSIGYRTGKVLGITLGDRGIVFLPLAHSLQRIAAYGGMLHGLDGVFPASLEALPETIVTCRPMLFAAVPRVFEKIHARIEARLAEAPPKRRKMFNAALSVARKVKALERQGKRVPRHLQLLFAVAEKVVLSKVRERIFGDRIRFVISGGAPIAVELLEFFHAIGVIIVEGYGLTETSAPCTINAISDFRFGTVGHPIPGSEIKIAGDGEVLIKGPGVFSGYYHNEEATSDAFEDGWFKSGDIGELDVDGYLKITDRKKDIIVTAAGKNVAPQHVENLLKGHPLISQVLVHGDKRKYLVALVTVDGEAVSTWASEQGHTLHAQPSLDVALKEAIGKAIEDVNADLPRYETVKKFAVLDEDFTTENGMLTPTMKVRRKEAHKRYGELLESLYE
jgi:long-chain acyl-CoA synthetase